MVLKVTEASWFISLLGMEAALAICSGSEPWIIGATCNHVTRSGTNEISRTKWCAKTVVALTTMMFWFISCRWYYTRVTPRPRRCSMFVFTVISVVIIIIILIIVTLLLALILRFCFLLLLGVSFCPSSRKSHLLCYLRTSLVFSRNKFRIAFSSCASVRIRFSESHCLCATVIMASDMPDLSHLTPEEREIIKSVMMRQKQEEERENEIMRWV